MSSLDRTLSCQHSTRPAENKKKTDKTQKFRFRSLSLPVIILFGITLGLVLSPLSTASAMTEDACGAGNCCTNGIDDDSDGFRDCADPDCSSFSAADPTCCSAAIDESAANGNCLNGIDDDCDGTKDCDELECVGYLVRIYGFPGEFGCIDVGQRINYNESSDAESPSPCSDGIDNNGDGRIDCADPGCFHNGNVCGRETICADGFDNNLNGRTDCADSQCSGTVSCPVEYACSDGLDNDSDGFIDCNDSDCVGTYECTGGGIFPQSCRDGIEVCSHMEDICQPIDQFMGDVYCVVPCLVGYDLECQAILNDPSGVCCDQFTQGGLPFPICSPSSFCGMPVMEICDDGVDNDSDGAVDCFDLDCFDSPICVVPVEDICDDEIDNDEDGFFDCLDSDCFDVAPCNDPSLPQRCNVDSDCLKQGEGEVCTFLDQLPEGNFCIIPCTPGSVHPDPSIICCEMLSQNGVSYPIWAPADVCIMPYENICDDGLDNDSDGFTDCLDSDCFKVYPCKDPSLPDRCNVTADCLKQGEGEVCTFLDQLPEGNFCIIPCTPGDVNPDPSIICCEIPTQNGEPYPVWAPADACVTSSEDICYDGIDNDMDSMIDCADSDCSSAPYCSGDGGPFTCPNGQGDCDLIDPGTTCVEIDQIQGPRCLNPCPAGDDAFCQQYHNPDSPEPTICCSQATRYGSVFPICAPQNFCTDIGQTSCPNGQVDCDLERPGTECRYLDQQGQDICVKSCSAGEDFLCKEYLGNLNGVCCEKASFYGNQSPVCLKEQQCKDPNVPDLCPHGIVDCNAVNSPEGTQCTFIDELEGYYCLLPCAYGDDPYCQAVTSDPNSICCPLTHQNGALYPICAPAEACAAPMLDTDADGIPDDLDGCPYDPAKTAPGMCGCGYMDVDTDGDAVADCMDKCPGSNDLIDTDKDGIPDGCDTETCSDGLDNDGDGAIDCQDSNCSASRTCEEVCTNAVDDDADGLIDCADPECAADPSCIEVCSDGIDNDLDGLVDCYDPDCHFKRDCVESCTGGIDEDKDGLIDCADSDCAAETFCMESLNCLDNIDNDKDGLIDCVDSDCTNRFDCFCPTDPCNGKTIGQTCGRDGGVCSKVYGLEGTICEDDCVCVMPDTTDCPCFDSVDIDSRVAGLTCRALSEESIFINPSCGAPVHDMRACGITVEGKTLEDSSVAFALLDGHCVMKDSITNTEIKIPLTMDQIWSCEYAISMNKYCEGLDYCYHDTDFDGIANLQDNCPTVSNSTQSDIDSDGIGDVCDDDIDGDSWINVIDNCPTVHNPAQVDLDLDGVGNLCDNCVTIANPDQMDTDGDGIADACDNCPQIANADQSDTDFDKIGNVCDICPTASNHTYDVDKDGTPDCLDDCPYDPDPTCVDLCPDNPNRNEPAPCGAGCDEPDSDFDGVIDCLDVCPNNPTKQDSEGYCGCSHRDDNFDDVIHWGDDNDNDAHILCDPCTTGTSYTYEKGLGLIQYPSAIDQCDNCITKSNSDQTDTDGDCMRVSAEKLPYCGDACDVCFHNPLFTVPSDFVILGGIQCNCCGCDGTPVIDSDGDGDPDCTDECPTNPNKFVAAPCGAGCNEPDSDGDGVYDCEDNCPNDANSDQKDTNGNGMGDICDDDNDLDGVPSDEDNCPKVANSDQLDTDNDGTGDACDACPLNEFKYFSPGKCGCTHRDDNFEEINNVIGWTIDNDNDAHVLCNPCTAGSGYTYEKGLGLIEYPSAIDACDNCVGEPNSDQADSDGDCMKVTAEKLPYCGDACDVCPYNSAFTVSADLVVMGGVQCNCCGCGQGADTDSDFDGNPDCTDLCPNNPDLFAPPSCGAGCDEPDSDGDHIADCIDNCPNLNSPDQTDTDGDGRGDVCDNCKNVANLDQADSDGDCATIDADHKSFCGDACEQCNGSSKVLAGRCGCNKPEDELWKYIVAINWQSAPSDNDSDGAILYCDNCNNYSNPSQADSDGDCWTATGADTMHCGDGCDECPDDPNKYKAGICGCGKVEDIQDSDGDGVVNCLDGCPTDPNQTQKIEGVPGCTSCFNADSDHDGTFDCMDECPNNPYHTINPKCGLGCNDFDTDSDGITNCQDNCKYVSNANQLDADYDGIGDACDNCDYIKNGYCDKKFTDCDKDASGIITLSEFNTCGTNMRIYFCDLNHDTYVTLSEFNSCLATSCDTQVASYYWNQVDTDMDGVGDACDNCKNNANANQLDSDSDCLPFPSSTDHQCGDACDNCPGVSNFLHINHDGDSFGDVCDNCDYISNPDQMDSDGDGRGQVCDNCPMDYNPDQKNSDTDPYGDACDDCPLDPNVFIKGVCPCGTPDANSDTDGDGWLNCIDGCPSDPNKHEPGVCGCGVVEADGDHDNVCDSTDNCVGVYNPTQADGDGDKVGTACDVCPYVYDPRQTDSDADGKGNLCDNCPTVFNPDQLNSDGDAYGNACDNCAFLPTPVTTDSDGDGIGDPCDGCPIDPQNDIDHDGVCGNVDNCPDKANADQADMDHDGIGNVCDLDVDGDGIPEYRDPHPRSIDADNDGLLDPVELGIRQLDPTLSTKTSPYFIPAVFPTNPTNPLNPDTDGDGDCDGFNMFAGCYSEDHNNNGSVDPGETDPNNIDTDSDGCIDSLEKGYTEPQRPDADFSYFIPDLDPLSTTDASLADSDGDGMQDCGPNGEDKNSNGIVDPGEMDPTSEDSDGDGLIDSEDNCPVDADPDQKDTDRDGKGNVCDPLTAADCQTVLNMMTWKNTGAANAAANQCKSIVEFDSLSEDKANACHAKCNALLSISNKTALTGREILADYCAEFETRIENGEVCAK